MPETNGAEHSRWERISEMHKTGVTLVVVHENGPGTMRVVRWDPDEDHDPLRRGSHHEDQFTHAFIVPDFEP